MLTANYLTDGASMSYKTHRTITVRTELASCMAPTANKAESLSQRAYHHLRDQILKGSLEPGKRISLRGVASTLGTSMAPVGDAIRELARDGLVEQEPGWGARVRQLDVESLRAQHVIRTALECEAVRHCARSATAEQLNELEELAIQLDNLIDSQATPTSIHPLDSRLHLRIAEFSRVMPLVELLRANQLVRMLARGGEIADRVAKPKLQHLAIIQAIRTGDPDTAERVMREHCERSMNLQIKHLAFGGLDVEL